MKITAEPHILIVDDDPDYRLITEKYLQQTGYTRVFASSSVAEMQDYVQEAFLAQAGVDLILMDIVMPNQTGLEGCEWLKSQASYRDIPVIMVTSLQDDQQLETAFSKGAMDYLVKPVNPIELRARVRSALALKRERDIRRARESELLELTQQLIAKQTQLEKLSFLDPLTGIYNQRGFGKKLEIEWLSAYSKKSPLALLLVDIDCFKSYNQTYGRDQGDGCLITIAQALPPISPSTFAGRYGGDTFALLHLEADEISLRQVAEALQHEILSKNIPHATSPIQPCITVSIGMATAHPSHCPGSAILIQRAEQALKEAKRNGRNQIALYKGVEG